jgi:tetratricopeptide (TPR) repeat protein
MLSQSLFALGRRDDAARELEAIDEEARTIEVYFALGRLAQERGDLEKAKEFLMAANEAQPNEPVVLNAMLNAEAAQGDLEASLNRIASAVEADPESATLRTLLGRVQLLSGDQESAEKSFEQAIALESKDLSAYRMLAEIHHGRGDFKKAIDVFDRASKAQPDAGWVYERLGLLHEKNDDAKSAISSYELAVEKDASLGISKNNLSYLLAENDGDLDRALTLAMEAKKLRPKDPGAADTLGWVLFKKGRTAEAITYLREAESGWGDDSLSVGVVKHHLAVAYEADGAPEKAEQVLADALAGLDRQLEQAKIAGTEIKEPYWVSAVREMQTRLKN